jgi:sialic acid synthase SpsE
MKTFELGGIPVGPSHPPLLLPDIGTFFNQSTDLAVELVRCLGKAGARIIKGEILHSADICLDDSTIEKYFAPRRGKMVRERYRDLIERKVLSHSAYKTIFQECRTLGLPFVVSIYDIRGAEMAREMGACALKIATSNVVHESLIRNAARMGLPLLIDTGKSMLSEIARAVEWARDAGAEKLIVQHSPPAPPAAVSHQNLRVLDVFAGMFDCPVGLSDHHAGPEMLYAAAARDVSVLEKGICVDNPSEDQDIGHALPVGRFAEVKTVCDTIWSGLGQPQVPIVTEKKIARMGLVARRDLAAGEVVSEATSDFAFPAVGVPVEYWALVQGWRIRRNIAARTPIRWGDLVPT